jgi:UDP-N-acetylmuramoyl-tripeptide--D-alanyl-D-alanine ligase
MSVLWTAEEAARATGGQAIGDWTASGVSIDSREIAPGDLFVALKVGRDGHDFVAGALASGAGAALVRDPSCAPAGSPLLVVDDTQVAMENLGVAARRRNVLARRVAITGSVGKTTVKEMTAAALGASGATHASIKSYNNHWGVPLTLARMPQDARYGVFEIGMNHGGEISRLVPQVRPHVAAITMVAPVHIEHFADEAGIADAKAEIFLGIEPGGFALVPADNPHINRLIRRASDVDGIDVVTFGRSEKADARIVAIQEDGARRIVTGSILGQSVEWVINEPGDHWVANSLCALTLTKLAGANVEAAAHALSSFGAIAGRGAVTVVNLPSGGSVTLVDEAYNANPASVAGALATLAARPGARRIAVLGDMLELGTNENAYHAGLVDHITDRPIDLVFTAGPRMAHLHGVLAETQRGAWAETAHGVIDAVLASLKDGDTIMVKGSNGSKTAVVVQAIAALGAPTRGD